MAWNALEISSKYGENRKITAPSRQKTQKKQITDHVQA
jgi:hypothetical protein